MFDVVAAGLDDGVTAADVAAVLDPTPAHTTVVSTLARLLSRRVVARHRIGRTMHYTAVGDSGVVVATSTAQRMLRVLAAAPDRSGALAQFVAELSSDDEATLARLLAAHPPARPPDGPDHRLHLRSAAGRGPSTLRRLH